MKGREFGTGRMTEVGGSTIVVATKIIMDAMSKTTVDMAVVMIIAMKRILAGTARTTQGGTMDMVVEMNDMVFGVMAMEEM